MATNERINISLPSATIKWLDRFAPAGSRSSLIDEAINVYLKGKSRAALRKHLKKGYLARAERDLAIAREWATLDGDPWGRGK